METKANFVLIGAFTLAAVAGAFLFVMWFSGIARLSPHAAYRVVFTGSVSGLSNGAYVQFNGLRVGEVTRIDFDKSDPSRVIATIDVDARAPIKRDTKARLEQQGLTGASVVALIGGAPDAQPLPADKDGISTIIAEPSQLQSLLQNVQNISTRADAVLAKIDKILTDNGPAIDSTLSNIASFSKSLGDSSSGIGAALKNLSDVGQRVGPLADHIEKLSDDADALIRSVDGAKLAKTVDNVEAVSDALAKNKSAIADFLADAGSLAKRLNGSVDRLDAALGDVDALVKTVDLAKLRGAVDNVASFTETLAHSKGNYEALLGDADGLVKQLGGSRERLDAALNDIDAVAKAVDVAKVHGAVDNVEAFTGTLAQSKDKFDSVLSDAGGLVKQLGGSRERLDAALSDFDGLAKAVDPAKVRGVVDNVDAFAAALAKSKEGYQSLVGDAGALAKRLLDSSQRLDSAINDAGALVKSFDAKKIAGAVDSVSEFASTLGANRGNVDRTLKNASELSAKLNESADKVDNVLNGLQNLIGSPETKGSLAQIGGAAQSVRRLADDLDARAKDIAVGLTRFSNTGLREFEGLAIDGRRVLNDIDRTVRLLEKNPSQVIFGAKAALPEYRGGP